MKIPLDNEGGEYAMGESVASVENGKSTALAFSYKTASHNSICWSTVMEGPLLRRSVI